MKLGGLRHQFFDDASAEAHWLAGLIAADGSVTQDRKRWSLSQSGDAGRDLIGHVRSLIGHTGAVTAYRPPRGQHAYDFTVTSPLMVRDLAEKYMVAPAKTLTYEWPPLAGDAARDFLRGYVDRDGCVGVYPTPQGAPFLHLSFVGTPAFIAGAVPLIPAAGRTRRITRCANLAEARYSGRHAWQACCWLYGNEALYVSAKTAAFLAYVESAAEDAPRWMRDAERRAETLRCLAGGMSVSETSAVTGTRISTIYRWKATGQDRRTA